MDWIRKNLAAFAAIVVGIALVFLCLLLVTCGREHVEKGVVKAAGRNDAAKDQASIERGNDTAAILNNQQERTDAIKSAPKGETGPATRALNCARWMRANPGKVKPAGC